MTIKEATLKSLDEIRHLANYQEVYEHIVNNNYYNFGKAKTPASTISACLGDFIRNGDTRVRRIKTETSSYIYYLTKNEQEIGVDLIYDESQIETAPIKTPKPKSYNERALHILLSSYLKNTKTYCKTIFHEQSKNSQKSNSIWSHPDMVGIKYLNLQSKTCRSFLNSINRVDTFKISSYELKKEINTDTELKKAYFQAVSNSSWANYGYLVALEYSDSLKDEMERLNQSFGIGIIQLDSNPFRSKILYPASFNDLDFKTIDKLCKLNNDFEQFIEQVDKLMTAQERYYKSTEKELEEFCDNYLLTDPEIEKYCRSNNIPITEKKN